MGELALGEVREVDVDYAVAACCGGEVGERGVAGGEDGWVGGGVVGFVDSYQLLRWGGGDAGGWGGEGGGVGGVRVRGGHDAVGVFEVGHAGG